MTGRAQGLYRVLYKECCLFLCLSPAERKTGGWSVLTWLEQEALHPCWSTCLLLPLSLSWREEIKPKCSVLPKQLSVKSERPNPSHRVHCFLPLEHSVLAYLSFLFCKMSMVIPVLLTIQCPSLLWYVSWFITCSWLISVFLTWQRYSGRQELCLFSSPFNSQHLVQCYRPVTQ